MLCRLSRRLLGFSIVILLPLFAAAPVAAHDMWLLPSDFTPAPGELVGVGLRIGHAGSADPVVRDPARLVRFSALGPEGETPLPGQGGADPAGYLRPASPGLYAVAYTSNAAYSELPPETFEAYLVEEGLEEVVAERRRRGESSRPGRELYARSLKALLQVGTPETDASSLDRHLGLPLELLLESLRPLRLRLEHQGAPLAGALVEVRPIDAEEPLQAARTDGAGRISLPLVAGTWLATAVTMHRSPSERAEWESLWTSLSFRLPAARDDP